MLLAGGPAPNKEALFDRLSWAQHAILVGRIYGSVQGAREMGIMNPNEFLLHKRSKNFVCWLYGLFFWSFLFPLSTTGLMSLFPPHRDALAMLGTQTCYCYCHHAHAYIPHIDIANLIDLRDGEPRGGGFGVMRRALFGFKASRGN